MYLRKKKSKAIPIDNSGKTFAISNNKTIADWCFTFYTSALDPIGYMIIVGPKYAE